MREEKQRMAKPKIPLAVKIGKRFRAERLARNLEQADLAKQLGLTLEAYGSYERGYVVPGVETILKIADLTQKPVAYFLNREIDCNLSPDEYTLLTGYRKLKRPEGRNTLLGLVQALAQDRYLTSPGPPQPAESRDPHGADKGEADADAEEKQASS